MKASTAIMAVGKKKITIEYPTIGLVVCYVLRDIDIMTSTSIDMENLRDVLKFVIQLISSKDEIYKNTFCKLWFFLGYSVVSWRCLVFSVEGNNEASLSILKFYDNWPFSKKTLILNRLEEFFWNKILAIWLNSGGQETWMIGISNYLTNTKSFCSPDSSPMSWGKLFRRNGPAEVWIFQLSVHLLMLFTPVTGGEAPPFLSFDW